MSDKMFAGRHQRNAVRRLTHEYADPEFDFQILKGRADARLRGLNFFGSTCVAAAFRNGDGIVQLSQCVSHNFFRGFCV